MLKISDLKKSLADLNKEQQRIKKDNLKITKQKQKALNKQVETIFLESLKEITWHIEFSDGRIYFFHQKEWLQKSSLRGIKKKNKIILNKPRSVGMSSVANSVARAAKPYSLSSGIPKESIYTKKFGKLFRFLEDNFDSPYIKYNGLIINITYEGFIIPLSFSDALSQEEIVENLNILNSFISKTKIKLNLESFNAETELLESEVEIRKRFLNENSNAFLFGL